MNLDFELQEDRGNVAGPRLAEAFRTQRPIRAVSMPLVHEATRPRRHPPAGHEKWIAAEFRVDAPPIKLWATKAAMAEG